MPALSADCLSRISETTGTLFLLFLATGKPVLIERIEPFPHAIHPYRSFRDSERLPPTDPGGIAPRWRLERDILTTSGIEVLPPQPSVRHAFTDSYYPLDPIT
jgi:hypothetical protein